MIKVIVGILFLNALIATLWTVINIAFNGFEFLSVAMVLISSLTWWAFLCLLASKADI
jgi:hypothetical protein